MAYRGGGNQISMIRFVAPVSAPLDPPIPFTCSCTTLTIHSESFVEEFNLNTIDYDDYIPPYDNCNGGPNSIITGNYSGSYFSLDQEILAFDDGRTTTLNEIRTLHGNISDPGNPSMAVACYNQPSGVGGQNTSHTLWDSTSPSVASTLPFAGIMVKRPNCLCTALKKFYITKWKGGGLFQGQWYTGSTTLLGFEDGFGWQANDFNVSHANGEINYYDGQAATTENKSQFLQDPTTLGNPATWAPRFSGMMPIGDDVQFFTMRPNDDQTDTIVTTVRARELKPGDLVLKCSVPGERATGTDCVRVMATSSGGGEFLTWNKKYASRIETNFPSTHFPVSTSGATTYPATSMSACLMLPNGIYIAWTPEGGSY